MPGAAGRGGGVRRSGAADRRSCSENGHIARARHDPRRRRRRERALRRHEAGEGRRARLHVAARPPRPTTRRRPTSSPRSASFNDDPAVDGILFQHPAPPQIDYEAALLEMDPDKDVDGLHPVNMGRLALDGPGPGAVHARRHRGAARVLRDPGRGPRGLHPRARHDARPPARAAAVAEAADRERGRHRRAHRRAGLARVHAAGRHRGRRRRRARASCSPSTSRRARSSSAAACATRAASCCPTSTRRCEEVAGAITPRVGGVGPTTIAMLFRNLVEAAERRAGA